MIFVLYHTIGNGRSFHECKKARDSLLAADIFLLNYRYFGSMDLAGVKRIFCFERRAEPADVTISVRSVPATIRLDNWRRSRTGGRGTIPVAHPHADPLRRLPRHRASQAIDIHTDCQRGRYDVNPTRNATEGTNAARTFCIIARRGSSAEWLPRLDDVRTFRISA